MKGEMSLRTFGTFGMFEIFGPPSKYIRSYISSPAVSQKFVFNSLEFIKHASGNNTKIY